VGINRVIGVEAQKVVNEALKTINLRNDIIRNVKEVQNPLGDGRAGERIAKILSEAVNRGLHVESVDSREDPYITYVMLGMSYYSISSGKPLHVGDIVATYDESGVAVADLSKARRIVVRMPRSRLYGAEGTDQGPSHT